MIDKNEILELIIRNKRAYIFIPIGYKDERLEYLENLLIASKVYKYFDVATCGNSQELGRIIKEKLDYDFVHCARGILDDEEKVLKRIK